MTPSPADPSARGSRAVAGIALALILIGSLALLHVAPEEAAGLSPVPDSMELAIGGRRLAAGDGFTIVVDGQPRPPRYPPWFSLVFEAPIFLLGSPIGLAILPVTAMALLGVAVAFHLGRRTAGVWGGSLAGLALVLLPLYRRSAGVVMTDVPCVALILVCMALYVRLREHPRRERLLFLAGGLLGSLAFVIRPVTGSALIPLGLLALTRPGLMRRSVCAACVAVPLIGATLAQLAYNRSTFGDAFRTGFHYWCAVPYDYSDLVMSSDNVRANLQVLIESKFVWLAAGVGVLGTAAALRSRSRPAPRSSSRTLRAMSEFTLACGLPMLVFHLHYYMARPRYYLPVFAMLLILAGTWIGTWVERAPKRLLVATLLLFAVIALAWSWRRESRVPHRYLAARLILERTPEDSIVISAIAPAYLEEIGNPRGSRTIVPLSRSVEYADKVLVRHRIDRSDPRFEGSQAWLLEGGGRWAVSKVATERMDEITSALRAGRRVFLDATDSTSTRSLAELAQIEGTFSHRPVEGRLQELFLR